MSQPTGSTEPRPKQPPTNHRLAYGLAAIAGGVVWAVLGLSCGDALFDHFFRTWDAPTPSENLALIAWLILVVPIGYILDQALSEPLGLLGMAFVYALDGVLWGLAILFVYIQGAALWRRWRGS